MSFLLQKYLNQPSFSIYEKNLCFQGYKHNIKICYFWYLFYMLIVYNSVQSNYSLYFLNSVVCLSPEVLSTPLSTLITCELLGFICIFIASITAAVCSFLRSGSEPRPFNLAQLSQQQILKLFESSLLRKQYYICCYYNHKTIVFTKD